MRNLPRWKKFNHVPQNVFENEKNTRATEQNGETLVQIKGGGKLKLYKGMFLLF
jgi:hypothetical protein